MKVLSRDFSRKEKALLLFLMIVLVGLAYYRFVDMNVRETIEQSKAEAENLQAELAMVEARVMRLRSLQSQLDKMEANGELSYMPSYNSSKEEVAFLNDILETTQKYSISFANVSRNGDQIRRSFSLQFTTANYSQAQEVIKKLCGYKNRCLVGDVQCTIKKDGEANFNVAAIFYETLVGGTPDAGLPQDSAAVNS